MPVRRYDQRALFDAMATPSVVLARDFGIIDTNTAFESASGLSRADLLGADFFEVFPGGPDDEHEASSANLRAAIQRTFETGRRQSMFVQRYDVRGSSGEFLERYWAPVSCPIKQDDEVVAALLETTDVTPFRSELLLAMEDYRTNTLDDEGDPELNRRIAHYVASAYHGRRHYADLATEASQLREALTSRSTIDQAIGLVMGERGCSAVDGFEVLVRLSQNGNVKLRDVAKALVYQAAHGLERPLIPEHLLSPAADPPDPADPRPGPPDTPHRGSR